MMEATDIRQQLCGAIERRSLVMFEYGDLIRVVEPHRFGVNSAGHEMMSGWLRAGYSRSDPAGGWRNYLLTEVSALQVLDAPFAGPRPGYAAHDARMRDVFCELTPTTADAPADGPFVVSDSIPRPVPTRDESGDDQRGDTPRSSSGAHPIEAARTRDGEVDPPGSTM
jgi:hypothetical protein